MSKSKVAFYELSNKKVQREVCKRERNACSTSLQELCAMRSKMVPCQVPSFFNKKCFNTHFGSFFLVVWMQYVKVQQTLPIGSLKVRASV